MSAGERIRVMIVDDHSIVRVGLKQVLDQSGEFEVVGQAADGEEAVRVAADVSPDVVVMDVMMPKKDGVEACREIMESAPETRVLILTASTEEDAIVEAVAAGATGYLQKETDREQLLSAVRNVALGNLRLPAETVRRAFEAIRGGGKTEDAAVGLTPREREILVSFAQGMSYARIAEARGIKPVTARNAIYGIQQKLGVRTMQGLVLWCVHNGLLDDYTHGRLSRSYSSRQSLKSGSTHSGWLQRHRHGRHLPPPMPSCHNHAAAALDELPRPSHTSKMVLVS